MKFRGTYAGFFENALTAILVGIVVLAPLVFVPFSGITLSGAKTLFVLLASLTAFLFMLISGLVSGTFSIPKSITLALGGVLAGVITVAALFAPSPAESWSGSFYESGTAVTILGLYMLMIVSAVHIRSARRARMLIAGAVAAFVVIVCAQILRLLPWAAVSLGGINSATGTLVGTWGNMAVLAGFIGVLTLVISECAPIQRRTRLLFRALVLAALCVLVVVNFPLMWVLFAAFALTVFVYTFSIARFGQEQKNGVSLFSLAVLLLSVLFVFAGGTLGGIVADYANVSRVEVRPSWQATITVVRETWREDLLLGAGPQRFSEQWLRFKPDGISETAFWNTDFSFGISFLPTFAVTTGLAGVLAWILFLGAFLYRGARVLFAAEKKSRTLLTALFLGALYLWAAAIFYVPNIIFLAFAFLFSGAFIGLAASEGRIPPGTVAVNKNPRTGFAVVLISSALIICVGVGIYRVSERAVAYLWAAHAQRALQAGNGAAAHESIARAVALHENVFLYRVQATIEQQRLAMLFREEGVQPDDVRAQFQDIISSALSAAQSAIDADKTDYRNWLLLSRIYASIIPLNISGAYENAVTALDEANAHNPRSPLLALERARTERAHGDNEAARTHIATALNLKNNYTDAILLLAQLEVEAGNEDKAIDSLEQAVIIEPNNAGMFFQLGLLRYRGGRYAEAESAFRRAVALVPEYANARYFLGLSLAYQDEAPEAIEQFERILETNPGNEEVERILENLREGQDPLEDADVVPPEEREEAPVEE